eukprot:PITA_04279
MCIDYRALNKKTLKNRNTIPRIDELMDELKRAKYFSKIDLRSGIIKIGTSEEHLQHLEEVLHILEGQQLYAKMSGCEIGLIEMLYLGHVIGKDVHQEKIQAILDWPTPKNVTELRGFLGLCTYYKWLVCEVVFTIGSTPLTDLTKRGAYEWTDVVQEAFEHLKVVMSSCPVLPLPNFSPPFVLECDALGECIGVVLM